MRNTPNIYIVLIVMVEVKNTETKTKLKREKIKNILSPAITYRECGL